MTSEGLARLWRACVKSGADVDGLLQDIAKQQAGPGGPSAVKARYEAVLTDLRGRMTKVALAHAQRAAAAPHVVYVPRPATPAAPAEASAAPRRHVSAELERKHVGDALDRQMGLGAYAPGARPKPSRVAAVHVIGSGA